MPASAGAEGEDGWLLGSVINTADGTTELVSLDARSFETPPVAVQLPHRIPPGLHGNWFPDGPVDAAGINAMVTG